MVISRTRKVPEFGIYGRHRGPSSNGTETPIQASSSDRACAAAPCSADCRQMRCAYTRRVLTENLRPEISVQPIIPTGLTARKLAAREALHGAGVRTLEIRCLPP